MINLKEILRIKYIFIALLVNIVNYNQSYAELSYNILDGKPSDKEQNNSKKNEKE